MLSRRKKIAYAMVLVAGVGAFAVERLLDSGPEPAAAATASGRDRPSSSAGATPAPGKTPVARPQATPEDPVIESLRKLPDVPQVRDLFARQDQGPRRRGSAGGSETDEPEVDPVEVFLRTHRLEATFRDGPDRVAVVGREMVRPGQCIDGFCLVKVEPFRAVFRHEGLEATLEMNADAKGPEKQASREGPETRPAD